MSRQIDTIKEPNYEKHDLNIVIQNQSRYWKMEIDFDPILDEYFGITVNKQQVTIDKKVWDLLKDNKIPEFVRGKLDNDSAALLKEVTKKRREERAQNRISKSEKVAKQNRHWNLANLPAETTANRSGKCERINATDARGRNLNGGCKRKIIK